MVDERADKLDELWDVYTADKQKTGRSHRRGEQRNVGEYHLVTNGIIFNLAGQVLLQQRSFHKMSRPGLWTAEIGGSALVGETSQQALVRELSEEMNICVPAHQLRFLLTRRLSSWIEDWYAIKIDSETMPIRLQAAEVIAADWLSLADALHVMQNNHQLTEANLISKAATLLF